MSSRTERESAITSRPAWSLQADFIRECEWHAGERRSHQRLVELVPAPRAVLGRRPRTGPSIPRTWPGSVAERWAPFVLRTLDADYDPKTIADWAKWVGVSRSVLRACRRLAHVAAHDARVLARLIPGIVRAGERSQPEGLLVFSDSRTLKRRLARVGMTDRETRLPTALAFADRQPCIPAGHPGLMVLRRWLRPALGAAAAEHA